MNDQTKPHKRMWFCTLLLLYAGSLLFSTIVTGLPMLAPYNPEPIVIMLSGVALYILSGIFEGIWENKFVNLVTYSFCMIGTALIFSTFGAKSENLLTVFPIVLSVILMAMWLSTMLPKLFHCLYRVIPIVGVLLLGGEFYTYMTGYDGFAWNFAFIALNALAIGQAWADMRQENNEMPYVMNRTMLIVINAAGILMRIWTLEINNVFGFFMFQSALSGSQLIQMLIAYPREKRERMALMDEESFLEEIAEEKENNIECKTEQESAEIEKTVNEAITQPMTEEQFEQQMVEEQPEPFDEKKYAAVAMDPTIQIDLRSATVMSDETLMQKLNELDIDETKVSYESQTYDQQVYESQPMYETNLAQFEEDPITNEVQENDYEEDEYVPISMLDEDIPVREVDPDFEIRKQWQKKTAKEFGEDFLHNIEQNIERNISGNMNL